MVSNTLRCFVRWFCIFGVASLEIMSKQSYDRSIDCIASKVWSVVVVVEVVILVFDHPLSPPVFKTHSVAEPHPVGWDVRFFSFLRTAPALRVIEINLSKNRINAEGACILATVRFAPHLEHVSTELCHHLVLYTTLPGIRFPFSYGQLIIQSPRVQHR